MFLSAIHLEDCVAEFEWPAFSVEHAKMLNNVTYSAEMMW